MTEQYITGRDGYIAGEAAVGRVKMRGGRRMPSYAEKVAPKKKGLSGKPLWDAIDQMQNRLLH